MNMETTWPFRDSANNTPRWNGLKAETIKWLVTALDTRNLISAQRNRNELTSTMKMEAEFAGEMLVTVIKKPTSHSAKPQQYLQRREIQESDKVLLAECPIHSHN